jgi:thiol-disulfide isomerase/thioredoxin
VTLEFPGPTGSSPESVGVRWEDDKACAFLAYSVSRNQNKPNRYAAVQPLPPGSYRLVVEKTPVSQELNVPVELALGKEDVDLRVLVAHPSQLSLLQGRPAPELAVTWRAIEQKTLSALKGKVIVLYFWGYWCVPCVQRMPSLMEAANKFRDEPVVWLAVHDGSLTKMEELDAKLRELEKRWSRPLNLTPVLDQRESDTSSHGGVTCSRYGIGIFPTLVVIDREGKVFGYVAEEDLDATIQKLLRK